MSLGDIYKVLNKIIYMIGDNEQIIIKVNINASWKNK